MYKYSAYFTNDLNTPVGADPRVCPGSSSELGSWVSSWAHTQVRPYG